MVLWKEEFEIQSQDLTCWNILQLRQPTPVHSRHYRHCGEGVAWGGVALGRA